MILSDKKKEQPAKPHQQYIVQPVEFDAYNKELPVQNALGTGRGKLSLEAADIRSTNFIPGVSGFRLTPEGLELGSSSGVFPAGSVSFTDIQDIATNKLLGRSTAGSGEIEEISVGSGLTLAGGTLTAQGTGDITKVGDVTSGDAFDGTQGTTFTFLKETDGTLKQGNSTTADTVGADLNIVGANGNGDADGGGIIVQAGAGGSGGVNGYGGGLSYTAGSATADGVIAGSALLSGGIGVGANAVQGGDAQVQGGDGSATGQGGNVYIKAGNGLTKGTINLVTADNTKIAALEIEGITSSRAYTFPDQTAIITTVTSGAGAPGSAPVAIGQLYIDTVGVKIYGSTGTTNSSDWKILN